VGVWTEIDGHRLQVLSTGAVLWEHDTMPGYYRPRHLVDPADGQTWTVISRDPLTLSPSLHCDASKGGCGRHGFVRDGRWAEA
jgi:hypothetical protein